MISSILANTDLEVLRRVRRITQALAELTFEYEAAPSLENLAQINYRVKELADLSAKMSNHDQLLQGA